MVDAPAQPPASSSAPSLTTTQASMPTLGAVIGSALGAYVSSKLGLSDPLSGHAIVVVTTGLATALFHWVGTKLGGLPL